MQNRICGGEWVARRSGNKRGGAGGEHFDGFVDQEVPAIHRQASTLDNHEFLISRNNHARA
jgi:hypothetical protein